jgi:WD40 repeat protein
MAFAPDGNTLISCSADKTIKLWNLERYEKNIELESNSSLFQAIVFSPDGKYVATASDDKIIKLINVDTQQEAV